VGDSGGASVLEGHIGAKSERIDIKQAHNFTLALSYLEDRAGQGWFVLHVDPRVRLQGVLSPEDLLVMLGFEKYNGTCAHLNRPCYFKLTQRVASKSLGLAGARRDFDRFVGSIQDLYERARCFTALAGDHSHFLRWGTQFSSEPEIVELKGQEPGWLAESRTDAYREAIEALEDAEARVKHFQTIEYCLWGKNDELVEAVHYTLSDLGLDPHKTRKGEHVDLILDYPPRGMRIGIEVTGTSGSIGLRSPKMNQVGVYLEDCTERQEACKGVILANPHCDIPLRDRSRLPAFTDPAVSVMKGLGVVGITTTDLYRVWQDVKDGEAEVGSVVEQICDHEGGVYT
jgi:hypothetical protein